MNAINGNWAPRFWTFVHIFWCFVDCGLESVKPKNIVGGILAFGYACTSALVNQFISKPVTRTYLLKIERVEKQLGLKRRLPKTPRKSYSLMSPQRRQDDIHT